MLGTHLKIYLKTSSQNSTFNGMRRTFLAIRTDWPPTPAHQSYLVITSNLNSQAPSCVLCKHFREGISGNQICPLFCRLVKPFAEVGGDAVTDCADSLLVSWTTCQRSLTIGFRILTYLNFASEKMSSP